MTSVLAAVDVAVRTAEGEQLTARIDSDGRTCTLRSTDLARFAAGRSTAELNQWADSLARQGVVLVLADEDGDVMRVGHVPVPWWQRLVTRSPHVRVVRWRAAAALKASALSNAGASLMPPPVEWPLLPALPWWNRHVTTTHDPYGGGHPRLYLSDTREDSSNRQVQEVPLWPREMSIGSAETADVCLEGLDDVHAVISRSPDDEYVLSVRSTRVPTYVFGMHTPETRLRTGCRVEIGPWRLTYVRDEHADHGRPHGGRIGGELGVQRTQRVPNYQR